MINLELAQWLFANKTPDVAQKQIAAARRSFFLGTKDEPKQVLENLQLLVDKVAIGVLTGDGLPSYDAWVQLADRASIAGYFWLEGNALGKAVDISKRLTPSADKAANDSRFTTVFTRLEALNQKLIK